MDTIIMKFFEDFYKEGKRKLNIVYYFGSLGFIAFLFTPREVAYIIALFGLWTGLAGWYNQSNVEEHKLKNGGGSDKK